MEYYNIIRVRAAQVVGNHSEWSISGPNGLSVSTFFIFFLILNTFLKKVLIEYNFVYFSNIFTNEYNLMY